MKTFKISFKRESLTFKAPDFPKPLEASLKTLAEYYYQASKGLSLGGDFQKLKSSPKFETFESFETSKKNHHFFALTGGKDSALLLALFKKMFPNERATAFYCPNINRSESPYEKVAARLIAIKLKVPFIDTKLSCSIKLNRSGHNIALREPLALASLFPWLKEFPTHIWFGSNRAFEKVSKEMPASSKLAADITAKIFAPCFENKLPAIMNFSGLGRKNVPPVHLMWTALEDEFPEIAKLASSCYSQKNFREHKHELLKKKVGDFPIYHGCGHCLKCHRINLQKIIKHGTNEVLLQHIIKAQETLKDTEIETLMSLSIQKRKA